MSSERLAISARGLSKAYPIQHQQQHGTLAEQALARLRRPFRRADTETFWALRDMSFDVDEGEVVGIIGRNGAGKSTLLKILSRITEPTAGRAELYGRTGSLLEVGTGFHRELTGRENIYLNGSILGMKRREIDRRFDEIVAFAGTERFLDTPVKRYSSGMFVRLAFAVAAHFDPEILIVDEVLAVGDAEFQRKCLGKMGEVARAGRTVLFVSHNLGTIRQLCGRALLLREGRLAMDGATEEVVRQYLRDLEEIGTTETAAEDRVGTGAVRVTAIRLLDENGAPTASVVGGDDLTIEIDYRNPGGLRHPVLLANVYTDAGVPVTSISTELTNPPLAALHAAGRFTCRIPRLPLLPGRYRVAIAIHADGESADYLPAGLLFEVVASRFYESGRVPKHDQAAFMLDHAWEHRPLRKGDEGEPADDYADAGAVGA